MNQDETIAVLYNSCFGGWRLNPLVTELYNKRNRAINPAFKPVKCISDYYYGTVVPRHDPILVDIYYELGANFDGKPYSKTKVETIPAKYKDCYHIQEHDGYEAVIINEDKYALDCLKEQLRILLQNTVKTDTDKITAIRQLLYTDCYTFIYCDQHHYGCIIKGNHPNVPKGYFMRYSEECDTCCESDWVNMGVINYNGSTFTVVESVTVNYDRYEGEFMFTDYIDTLTDENGDRITQNELLNEWIEAFSKD
jgi:hypothetical protein